MKRYPCAMTEAITLDYTLSMAAAIGSTGGLTEQELDAQRDHFAVAVAKTRQDASSGRIGFWDLPQEPNLAKAVRAVAQELPEGITDVLVLGIGGSSLGARAIYQALCGPVETLGLAARQQMRLHLPDNSDPYVLKHLLDALRPQSTCVLVISKSGGTVETAAQMLITEKWLEDSLGAKAKRHLVAITDPEQGSLREKAINKGWQRLSVPSNVGGRFSVLSAVGLLPAQLCGVDIEAMLAGAQAMAARCAVAELNKNPAGILAMTHVLQHRLRNRSVHVMMPYSDQLRPFAAWYVQLWAESLGKLHNVEGDVVESGPTPLPAVGATDQHAQMQLFMEGPRDKLITFIRVAHPNVDLAIPSDAGATSYLGGHTMTELLDAELEGTRQALASLGRPSLLLTLPRLDAFQLGALFYLYEAATAFAGELYGVDPFDQPGVELGKRLAFGLLGRPGYEETGRDLREAIKKRGDNYQV